MNQPPFTPMLAVYALLEQIVKTSLAQEPHSVHKDKIRETLRLANNGVRNFLVTESSDLTQTWARIRTEPPVTDFLMDVTSQLHLALAGSPISFEQLTQNIAMAMGSHRETTGSSQFTHSVIDSDLMGRMPLTKHAVELLQANPWYVTLTLIGHRASQILMT